MSLFRDPFAFEIEKAQKIAIAVEEARKSLPVDVDFEQMRPFGLAIISAMTSCFYAAGLRDKALEGARWVAPQHSVETCRGYANAMSLAADAGDYAFIELAEQTAIAEEMARLRAQSGHSSLLEMTEPLSPESSVDSSEQEETIRQQATQRVRSTIWQRQVVDQLRRALKQDSSAQREHDFAFWFQRLLPRYDFNQRVDSAWLGQDDWLSLCELATQQKDSEKLNRLFAFSKQSRSTRALGQEAVRCLLVAWKEHWIEGIELCARLSPQDSSIRQSLLQSAHPDAETPERSRQLMEALRAGTSPSDEELRGWLVTSVQSSLSASVPTATPQGEAFFQRAQVLLDMGVDPSLPGVMPKDYSNYANSCSSALLPIFAPYFFKDSPTKLGARFDEWTDRMLQVVLQAPNARALCEKINVPTAWSLGNVRKVSWLSLALLSERFPAAEALVNRGADWRDAKNVFETKSNKRPQTSPAFAFFEAMQLRETLHKKKRLTQAKTSLPITVIESPPVESRLSPSSEPTSDRLRTRRL